MNKKKYVVGFFYDSDFDVVVMIKKNRPEWQKGFLNGIGGKIEEGETQLQAMVREFKEETGLNTTSDDWQHTVHLIGQDFEVYFFLCHAPGRSSVSVPKYQPRSVTDEQVSWEWIGDSYDSKFLHNLRWILPLSLDKDIAKPVVALDKTLESVVVCST